MKKFLVTYHAPASATEQMKNATPAQIMAATQPWMDWKAANEANIVSFGSRLFPGEERSSDSDWTSSASEVTGFSILQANSLEEIKEKLANHPQLAWDATCRISINEFQPM